MALKLDLLATFHAIMEERNLTHAAERLGLSQSTVSAALTRLRAEVGDELFIRTRYGMKPTERAESMAPVVAEGIDLLSDAFSVGASFDPQTSTRRFRIGASVYFECAVLPDVIDAMHRQAPGTTIDIVPIGGDLQSSTLRRDGIDLVLHRMADPPKDLVVEQIITDDIHCLVPAHIEATDGVLSRQLFESLPHVMVAPPGRWRTGLFEQIEQHGLRRNVLVKVSNFLAAPIFAHRVGGVVMLPTRVAALYEHDERFRIVRPPVAFLTSPLHMAWHPRFRSDAGHVFLRDLTRAICASAR